MRVMSTLLLAASALRVFGGVDSSAYPVPLVPEPLSEERLLDRSFWSRMPEIKTFRLMHTEDYFTTGNLSAHAAHSGDILLIRVECDRGDGSQMPMARRYASWMEDFGAEVFLEIDGSVHQYVVNARGAICHYVDHKLLAVPQGVTVRGKSEAGRWSLVLGVPLGAEAISSTGLNIRVCQPSSFTVYCEMEEPRIVPASGKDTLDPVGQKKASKQMGFVPLKAVPAMSEEEARAASRRFNGEFYGMLGHYATCEALKELWLYEKPCGWDLSKLHQLDEALNRGNLNESERERLYRDLRSEFARFQSRINPMKDHSVTLVPGPLTADFTRSAGRLRHLHGTNLGPRLSGGEILTMNEPFKALNFSYVRTHDAPLNNPGMRLVDTSLIFANEHADPADPRNYYFKPTDDYLLNLDKLGCGIVYRLGVSIEHSVNKYAAHAPKDYDAFAEICAGIVRHYNAGWANGYKLNIKYWEVWNEPNLGPQMWDKSLDEYNELYVTVAKRLKREFPDIKVGGWSSCGFQQQNLIDFLKKCVIKQAPLDFVSWHRYDSNVEAYVNDAWTVRAILDAFGFKQVETHLNEWHYFGCSWADYDEPERYKKLLEKHMGVDSAVFMAQVLSRWQDTPLDLSNYYATFLGSWSVRDLYGNFNKVYYGLLAYGQMMKHLQRMTATTSDDQVSVLAGHDGQGQAAVLVTAYQVKADVLELELKGCARRDTLTVKVLDESHNLEPVKTEFNGNRLLLRKASPSSLYLITFTLD